jgi:hypothetical protein
LGNEVGDVVDGGHVVVGEDGVGDGKVTETGHVEEGVVTVEGAVSDGEGVEGDVGVVGSEGKTSVILSVEMNVLDEDVLDVEDIEVMPAHVSEGSQSTIGNGGLGDVVLGVFRVEDVSVIVGEGEISEGHAFDVEVSSHRFEETSLIVEGHVGNRESGEIGDGHSVPEDGTMVINSDVVESESGVIGLGTQVGNPRKSLEVGVDQTLFAVAGGSVDDLRVSPLNLTGVR